MIDKPYSKGSLQGAALYCLAERCSTTFTIHGCKGGAKLPCQPLHADCRPPWPGAATFGAVCGGGKPDVMFCLRAWTWALACAPWMALHYSVPVATPRPFHFRAGNKDVPGYTWHQKWCANNCPGSEHVAPWTPSLGEKKTLACDLYKPRVCAGTNKLAKATSYAWRPLQCAFAIPAGRSEGNIKWTAISHWQSQMHLRKMTGQDLHRKVNKLAH